MSLATRLGGEVVISGVAVKLEYNPRIFLQVVPADLLRQYFDQRQALQDFAWTELGNDVEPLYAAWMNLPLDMRQTASVDFQRVCGLALKGGIQTLLDVGLSNNLDIAPLVKAGRSNVQKVFRVLLEKPEIFRIASQFAWADGLRRYWFRRHDLPHVPADLSESACLELKGAVSKYYIENQCRGEYCSVEVHERGGLCYCMVYLADHPSAETCFEGSDQLKHMVQQRAFDVVFMFDDNGRLELYAEGATELRRDMAVLFARHILKQEVTLDPIAGAVFDLDRFKDLNFRFQIEPADRIKSMRLLSMRFMAPDTSGGRVTFSTPARSGPSSLHNWIMRGLNAKEVPLGTLVVENVQIQATFEEGEPRTAPVRFNLTSDNGCSLKDTPEHSRIRQCLKRSEIMLNSSLDRILRRADVRDHVITNDEVQGWPADDRAQILDLKLLHRMEDADFIKCDACGKAHAFESFSQRVGGLRIRCPQIGTMRISQERSRRWDVDLNRLAQLLASALDLSLPGKTLKPGRLWLLGKRSVAGRTAEFFLVVGSHWPDGLDILTRTARLRNSPAPIILCPDCLPEDPEWHQEGRALFSLTELARITEAQLVIQVESLEDLYRQIAAGLDQPLVPTPVEQRPQRIKAFQQANNDCILKQIHFWANVSAGDFNKWKNGRPDVKDASVKAIRIENLLQLGRKARE